MSVQPSNPNIVLPEYEWKTLRRLAGAISPALAATDAQKPEFEHIISFLPPAIQFKLRLVLKVLSFYGPSSALTLSPKLVIHMSDAELYVVLKRWSTSSVAVFRMFFGGLLSVSIFALYKNTKEELVYSSSENEHPDFAALKLDARIFTLPKVKIPKPLHGSTNAVISADVAIMGTGCSAMVAAYLLTKAGFSVLLVEKGYLLNAMTSPKHDYKREEEAFERKCTVISNDGTIIVLAGSTVGGGGAINWSCSLRTPESIRNEWVSRSGVELFASGEYDHAMDEIERIMQVTDDVGHPHSFTNQLILNSATKLGYPNRPTGQNTGGHRYNSGFLEFGSRSGEKGGIAEFLRYATANGAQILQRSYVHSIRHRNGYATGLNVVVNGSKHVVVNSKRVVCAGGSLHTPALLQRSKFTNKHIGKGLKLHPVTVAFGQFDDVVVNKRRDPIMTAVTTQADNVDGLDHGAKIEAIHHQPHLLMNFLPWRNGKDWEEKVRKLPNLCALLIITRDKHRGSVSLDSYGEPSVNYTPSSFDLRALRLGSMCGANLLYMGGADRIFLSSSKIPDFVSSKPKEQRSIWDTDYRNWLKLCDENEFELYDTRVASAHQMSSCRMSNLGPAESAVDARGHLHECKNVHVVDTSVFPSASGVNPMITCMSTAYVLSEYLVAELRKTQTKL